MDISKLTPFSPFSSNLNVEQHKTADGNFTLVKFKRIKGFNLISKKDDTITKITSKQYNELLKIKKAK